MSDLWLNAVGKACSAYESGAYARGNHQMREACFLCCQSWKSSIEREENCKNCKTVKILTAIIMAKGYCPLRSGIPTKDRSAKWTHCTWWWSDFFFRSLTCLQSSVLVCKNIEPHWCLCRWALNRKYGITPSTMKLPKPSSTNCSPHINGVFQI